VDATVYVKRFELFVGASVLGLSIGGFLAWPIVIGVLFTGPLSALHERPSFGELLPHLYRSWGKAALALGVTLIGIKAALDGGRKWLRRPEAAVVVLTVSWCLLPFAVDAAHASTGMKVAALSIEGLVGVALLSSGWASSTFRERRWTAAVAVVAAGVRIVSQLVVADARMRYR
jgi:hypothetical protein